MSVGDWRRVSRSKPCPICGTADWCTVSADGSAACCMRVESTKRLRNGGWLHRLHGSGNDWRPRPRTGSVLVHARRSAGPDFGKLAELYQKAVNPFHLIRFASELGIRHSSLMRLGVGWATANELRALGTKCTGPGCWTWPMHAGGRVVGIRLRTLSGFKYAIGGSQQGLFVPTNLPDDGPLLVAEGSTDTAALLQLEFATIGRPSCSGAVQLVCDFARGRSVVVVADGDGPGQRGAEVLARALRLHCRDVRVIRPPDGTKDARAWVCSGATATDVRTAIDAAEPVRMTIETNTAGC